MAKILELNGLIHSRYDNEAQMASALGWPRQRLNKITNGDKEPDLDEVQQIADVLEVPFMSVAQIFLSKWSPIGDNRSMVPQNDI